MDAQIQDALAKVAEAQKALAEAQAAALAQAAGVAPAAVQTPEPSVPEPAPAVGAPKLKVFKTDAAPAAAEKSPAAAPESAVPKLKVLKSPVGGSTSFFHGSRCGSPACGCRGELPLPLALLRRATAVFSLPPERNPPGIWPLPWINPNPCCGVSFMGYAPWLSSLPA